MAQSGEEPRQEDVDPRQQIGQGILPQGGHRLGEKGLSVLSRMAAKR